jgi:hypothetical protein
MSDATAAALAALNVSIKSLTIELAGLRADVAEHFGEPEESPPR